MLNTFVVMYLVCFHFRFEVSLVYVGACFGVVFWVVWTYSAAWSWVYEFPSLLTSQSSPALHVFSGTSFSCRDLNTEFWRGSQCLFPVNEAEHTSMYGLVLQSWKEFCNCEGFHVLGALMFMKVSNKNLRNHVFLTSICTVSNKCTDIFIK